MKEKKKKNIYKNTSRLESVEFVVPPLQRRPLSLPVPDRKPRKEEHLSEEAAKVMASLPDLSFMQAKVLMFPTTLTPLSSQATPD